MNSIQPPLLPTTKSFVPMHDRRGVLQELVDKCDVLYTESHLAADLDEGAYEWVFDISTRDQSVRTELRFFPGSVERRIRALLNPGLAPLPPHGIDDVLARQLPVALRHHNRLAVHGRVLASALNCSPETINKLIDAGELTQFGDSQYRRGRGGDSIVTVASVQTFLQQRRLQP